MAKHASGTADDYLHLAELSHAATSRE